MRNSDEADRYYSEKYRRGNGLTPVPRTVINKKTGKKETKWAYIDQSGKMVMESIFDLAGVFQENGLAIVRQDQDNVERFGFIDGTGKTIVPLIYEIVWPFDTNGFSSVKRNNKWGFLNNLGEVDIPLLYDDAWSFENGKAQVRIGKEFYSVDTLSEMIPSDFRHMDTNHDRH